MSAQRAFEEPKRVRCAVSRCQTVVDHGKIMCLTHWLLIPEELRREIGNTYRARQMGNYQDAYRRAVDHVESATGVFTGIFVTSTGSGQGKPAKRDAAGLAGRDFRKVGSARPTRIRAAVECPSEACEEGGGSPVTPPSKPILRRPRLTVKRLAAVELAVTACLQQQSDGVAKSFGDIEGALLWVRGERAKRRARKVARI